MDDMDGFAAHWKWMLQQPVTQALMASTLVQYRAVARKIYSRLHQAGLPLQADTSSIITALVEPDDALTPPQLRIARAILNTHWGTSHGVRISSCDWQNQSPKEVDVPTWHCFVPRCVSNACNFGCFADCIETFIASSRPEIRIANNIRHSVTILFSLLEKMNIEDWKQLTRSSVVGAIVAHLRTHGGGRGAVTVGNRLLGLLPQTSGLDKICLREVRMHVSIAPTVSHHPPPPGFNEREVHLLKAASKASVADQLVVTLMSQTGLRCRAVAWLRLDSVYDRAKKTVRHVGVAREKNMCVRHFPIGEELRVCFERYIHEYGRRCVHWLFPSPRNTNNHIATCTIQRIVKRLCIHAGITSTVGTHGFRKFVVRTLMASGNSLEYISKWLGHKHVETTFRHYWDVGGREAIIAQPISASPQINDSFLCR